MKHTPEEIEEMLDFIRRYEDLEVFRNTFKTVFPDKYKVTGQQFNFLLSVVAAERIKDKNLI